MTNLFLALAPASTLWTWLHRLGGPGLIVLGLLDNSAIPLPGSMDVFVIVLSAHHRGWWPYYAFMAVVGAVIGGYVTYRLASKGGEGTLEKKSESAGPRKSTGNSKSTALRPLPSARSCPRRFPSCHSSLPPVRCTIRARISSPRWRQDGPSASSPWHIWRTSMASRSSTGARSTTHPFSGR